MVVMNATTARTNFFKIMRSMDESSEPIIVTGRENNIVIVSEDEWRGIQETMRLKAVPGLVSSIKEGLDAEPEELYTDEEVWED